MLIDGLKIAEKINKKTKTAIWRYKKAGFNPQVVVFLVGGLKESELYVKQKQKLAEKLGFNFVLKKFPSSVSEIILIKELKKAQSTKNVVGCIVQLPLPKKINQNRILAEINPTLDIDCLTKQNLGRLLSREVTVEPPTAGAMMEVLSDLQIDLSGKVAVVVGAGLLVGRPLTMLLSAQGATVVLCNSRTVNLGFYTKKADIIMTGAGKKNLITARMVKKGAVVVDAGFIYENGRVFGDVDFQKIDKMGAWVTPTPGGIGPITVSKLLANAAICAKEKFKK